MTGKTIRGRPARSGAALAALGAAAVLVGFPSAPEAGPAGSAAKPRVTFVGDSISASLDYVTPARRLLARGFRMQYDLEVCRRLVRTSCSFRGRAPPNALQAVRSLGRSIGDVLIVHVGYNEGSAGYGQGMRRVIRAARAQGVGEIVWVTLRESRDVYQATNVAIREEARRWPQVQVADWETKSRGRPWFREDGLHLNSAGASGLARLLRQSVLRVV